MTQDVQPLTWQKRTNLEEHQQFFSKINEIIDKPVRQMSLGQRMKGDLVASMLKT